MGKFNFESLDESGVAIVEEEVKPKPEEDNQPDDDKPIDEPEDVQDDAQDDDDDDEYEEVDEDDGEVNDLPEDDKTPKKKEKQPYTEAEIQEILSSDGDIDTSRLSPAEQATMKAMQRGFTPKLQEAANLKREVEELRRQVEGNTPKEQAASDIFEAYDQDPDGVLQYVDTQINELVATGDTSKMVEIRQLESLKHEFNRRDVVKLKQQTADNTTQHKHMNDILSAVPDLATKQQALKEFAINELGYSEEELAAETNPSISGVAAVRTIKRINTAYDKAQARVTVKRKKRVKKATPVEKPSSVGYEKPDVDEIKQAKAAALESGNFGDFFAALGED